MMKLVLLLTILFSALSTHAKYGTISLPSPYSYGSSYSQSYSQSPSYSQPDPYYQSQSYSYQLGSYSQPTYFGYGGTRPQYQHVPVDYRLLDSDYHFSWKYVGTNNKWTWPGAIQYCRNLGPGWGAININTGSENALVISAMSQSNIPYIWTGGYRGPNGFIWSDGSLVLGGGWSYTGGLGRPQPDNREGNENCLAVLNNFYGDGIKWHDVACHNEKLVICERKKRPILQP